MNGRLLLALPVLLLAFVGCDSSVNHQETHEKKVEASLASMDARLAALEGKLAAVEARLARIEEKLPPAGKPDEVRHEPPPPAPPGAATGPLR